AYFFSFGMSAAFAIMVSLLVSFTLTPMLCSRFLKVKHSAASVAGHGVAAESEEQMVEKKTKERGLYAAMDRVYGYMLHWSLTHRWSMMGLAALVVASVVAVYPYVGQELVPDDDQGEFNVSFRLPQ